MLINFQFCWKQTATLRKYYLSSWQVSRNSWVVSAVCSWILTHNLAHGRRGELLLCTTTLLYSESARSPFICAFLCLWEPGDLNWCKETQCHASKRPFFGCSKLFLEADHMLDPYVGPLCMCMHGKSSTTIRRRNSTAPFHRYVPHWEGCGRFDMGWLWNKHWHPASGECRQPQSKSVMVRVRE